MSQILESQQSPHISPSRARYGVSIVRNLEKINRVIMAQHCNWNSAHLELSIKDDEFGTGGDEVITTMGTHKLGKDEVLIFIWKRAKETSYCLIQQGNISNQWLSARLQDCSISSASSIEILQSCTKPFKCMTENVAFQLYGRQGQYVNKRYTFINCTVEKGNMSIAGTKRV